MVGWLVHCNLDSFTLLYLFKEAVETVFAFVNVQVGLHRQSKCYSIKSDSRLPKAAKRCLFSQSAVCTASRASDTVFLGCWSLFEVGTSSSLATHPTQNLLQLPLFHIKIDHFSLAEK